MAATIVYGMVNADRNLVSGSGDFTVGEKVETGIHTITFGQAFNDISAGCYDRLQLGSLS